MAYSSDYKKLPSLELLWKACLGQLQLQTTRANFDTWLKDSAAVSLDGTLLTIEVPSSFAAEWLEQRLSFEIRRAASALAGKTLNVSFQVRGASPSTTSRGSPAHGPYLSARGAVRVTGTNSPTFASFIESPSSRLALAAAFVATSEPGVKFNPLFIHGHSGFGKTHLLKAICHGLSGQGLQPLYVTAETFTNDFILAVQRRETPSFKEKYLSPDMVLIDDVQFLVNKLRTQDALFHVLEDLLTSGKQIVFACDRAPSALNFQEERLSSRLQSGLVAEIGASSSETKALILISKARASGIELTADIAAFLADSLPDNIRILLGCLTKYLALLQLGGATPSKDTASLALAGFSTVVSAPPRIVPPLELLSVVSDYFSVSSQALIGPSRSSSIVVARHVAMFLLREDHGCSLTEIGELLGGRDHSTVLYGCSKITSSLLVNSSLVDTLAAVRLSLTGRLSTPPPTAFPQEITPG